MALEQNPNNIKRKFDIQSVNPEQLKKLSLKTAQLLIVSLSVLNMGVTKVDNVKPVIPLEIQPTQLTKVVSGVQRINSFAEQLVNNSSSMKSIVDYTFELEGLQKGASITEVSNHGSETFKTTAAGITEKTYLAAQQKNDIQIRNGTKQPKPLSQITVAETMSILQNEYWNKLDGHETLPQSVMMMRFQSIWNLGEGREAKIWEETLAKFPNLKNQINNPVVQKQVISSYANAQKSITAATKPAEYVQGIYTRIDNSLAKAQSMIK